MTFEPKQKERMIALNVHLPAGLASAFRRAAQSLNISASALVRQMIQHCLDDMKHSPERKPGNTKDGA